MKRRLLITTAPIAMLGGCASLSTGQIATDVSTLASGLQGMLVQLGQLGVNISTSVMATVGTAVASLQKAADAVAATYTTAQALPLVQQIASYVNAIVSALGSVPGLPAIIQGILAAAQVLLPIIEQAVGMITAAVSASAMSPTQARQILTGASASVPR